MTAVKKRDTALDGLKFSMICLVIIGHAIEPTRYIMMESGMLYSVIYAFHMPLFIILSGYFSKKQNIQKINKQAVNLFETYIVMDIIIGLLFGRGLIPILLKPSPSCWYILSLICWRYLLYWMVGVRKMRKNTILICCGIVALWFPFHSLAVKLSEYLLCYANCAIFPTVLLGILYKSKSY